MERDAAHRLMRRLKRPATCREFCCAHRYRPGDLSTRDHSAIPHYAQPIDAPTGRTAPQERCRRPPAAVGGRRRSIVPLGLPRAPAG